MENLMELTNQESGVVIYGNEVIICNWSSINGYPRLFVTGLVGLGEQIPETEGEKIEDIGELFDDKMILYDANDDQQGLYGYPGTLYQVDDDILVIAPKDWA